MVNFSIAEETPERLIIRDEGPWDRYMTITNGAEEVVLDLVRRGTLKHGQRLFYFDSEGEMDELLVKYGRFAGFAPGPQRTR